jgi:2-keto-3-deoxy-L-rhamnonate aldolase RhmA
MNATFSNPTLDRLRTGEVTQGLFIVSASPIVAEVCATLGYDWLVFDMEASPVERRDVVAFLTALKGETAEAFVRVPRNEHSVIEQILDLGVAGIIVPKVNTAEDAIRAVDACRYPPSGKRGLNPVRASRYFSDVAGYLASANRNTALFVQIESKEALDNVHDIAQVEGVDGLFVGCGDLALSLGQLGDLEGETMRDAARRVLESCRKAGIIAGIFAYSPSLSREYLAMGYQFVAVGNDIKALRDGAGALLEQTRTV